MELERKKEKKKKKIFVCLPPSCTLTLFQVFYFASSSFGDCFSIHHSIRIYYFLVSENRNIQNSKMKEWEWEWEMPDHVKEEIQNIQLLYLPASMEIADIRGPYVPLFGTSVVPFPDQWKRISKILFSTNAVKFLTTALSTPCASFSISKSFSTSSSYNNVFRLNYHL